MLGFELGPTWYAGRLFGVPIRLHWSLGLMCAFQLLRTLFTVPHFFLYAVLAEVLIIGSIYVHEMAHALVARTYGLRALDVTLHAFGGFARMSGEPGNTQQVVISAAGPIANLSLWMLFSALTRLAGGGYLASALDFVASFNFMIGLFNMIPAYPLDGGNMLLHGLRSIAPFAQANWLAFKTGVVLAIPMGLYGLMYNQLVLALVAYLIYQASDERLRSVGHVGGWEYWKARLKPRMPKRRAKITPLNVDWKKYQPQGADEPDDKPPTIH